METVFALVPLFAESGSPLPSALAIGLVVAGLGAIVVWYLLQTAYVEAGTRAVVALVAAGIVLVVAFLIYRYLPQLLEGNQTLQRRGSFSVWWAVILGLLGGAIVVVLYAREAGRLGVLPRVGMAVVRVAIIVTVAFLLLRPVWVSEDRGEKPRPVVVLLDVSRSMDRDDPRPDPVDQGRAAIALGLVDPDRLPTPAQIATLGERLPNRPKRIDVAVAALNNPRLDLFRRLAVRSGPLEVYTFGSHRTGRSWVTTDWLAEVKADEPKTAIVESVFELFNRDESDLPAAVVLITDGRENAGPRSLDDLQRECARRNIPVFVYGVGSSAFGQLNAAFGSAQADGTGSAGAQAGTAVDVPNTLFVDDLASIPIRYTVKGVSRGTATIVLKYGDREVLTEKYPFTLTPAEVRAGKTFSHVLKFVPTKQDAESKKQEYSATITVTTGTGARADTISHQISRPAQVIDRKLKVLVVDSLPRRDFQFLMRALLRDRLVEAKFYLTEGDRQAMRSSPPFDPNEPFDPRYPWLAEFSHELNGTLNMDRDEFRKLLFAFDLLILGDVPAKFFSREQQEVIKEFVTEGGGLIHIAGRWHAPAGWAADPRDGPAAPTSPIADVLPVEFVATRFPIQALDDPPGFVPVLAPAAARTPLVALEDDPLDNAELWGKPGTQAGVPSDKQLKPMFWFYPVTKVKPAADVFLVHPTERTPAPDDKPMPLLVGHHYGKGYALFVGFDDTWRWRFNSSDKFFGRFWTQAVYTAGIPRIVGTKQTQISINTMTPKIGKTGEVYVRAFDENFKPLLADQIEGTLEWVSTLDGKSPDPNDKDRVTTVTFRKVPGVDGEYVVTIPYNHDGQFKLTVDPKNKNPATLNYQVTYEDTDELAPGALDAPAMQNLAQSTGAGKLYREEDLLKLPDAVQPQAAPYLHKQEILLWNKWALFLLIGLLTIEWLLRKFNGLS